jgi:hypothetical protein
MASKVFISYRRDDSAGHAGRVHDRLEREFGANLLFMDVNSIPLGVNFIKVLTDSEPFAMDHSAGRPSGVMIDLPSVLRVTLVAVSSQRSVAEAKL